MKEYDKYNREERAICAHLFRLLHENLDLKEKSPLGQLLNYYKLINQEINLTNLQYKNIGIFCEVAIIRDAFCDLKPKPDVIKFMDDLTRIIIQQENVNNCKLYSSLDNIILKNPELTHPKQIRQKATSKGIQLTEEESKVFGAMQGIFNAKPDLVVTIDNLLLVFEAKFTEKFDKEQLKRTKKITKIWSQLLYKDFGFIKPPNCFVIKLGANKYSPDINWSTIYEIVKNTYTENDRTFIAFKASIELLKEEGLE